MKIEDTASLMTSTSYKDRFRAEYFQAKIRYFKLRNIIVKAEAKTIDFKPDCPLDVLKAQSEAMWNYIYYMEVRAEIEKISLKEIPQNE